MDGLIKATPGITGYLQRGGETPPYTGEYEVTPKVGEETILQTKNKCMAENVTVKEIQIAEVSNSAGGKTITIGGIKNV